MSKNKETTFASDGGPELTSAGVPWREVPEFARHYVEWMDGRHGSPQTMLPPIEVVPVPDVLNTLPFDSFKAALRRHQRGAGAE